jgi:hypothetical protein
VTAISRASAGVPCACHGAKFNQFTVEVESPANKPFYLLHPALFPTTASKPKMAFKTSFEV